MTVDVFRHDDAHVADVADGDGEARERHDVGIDAEGEHQNEAEPEGKRQRDENRDGAAQMQQKDEDDRRGHERFFGERGLERVDGLVDDVRAVVERHDADPRDAAIGERLFRQAGFELLDFRLHPLDDVQRVLAVAHQRHAAHGFDARLVERAATEVRPDRYGGDVLHLDRRSSFLPDDDLLDVLGRLDEADAADEKLDAILLQHLRADIDIRLPHGLIDIEERDAVRPQFIGVNVDLILLHEAADTRDFTHAFDGVNLVAQIPILDTPQLREVEAFALDGVPENLPERRGIRADDGRDAGRQALLRDVHSLDDARACPVVIHLVFEDDEDHREAEARHAADGLYSRRAGEARGQRIGDLIVHVLGRAAGPVGEDDDLLFADVRDGIDWCVLQREIAANEDGSDADDDEERIPKAPVNERGDHGSGVLVLGGFRHGRLDFFGLPCGIEQAGQALDLKLAVDQKIAPYRHHLSTFQACEHRKKSTGPRPECHLHRHEFAPGMLHINQLARAAVEHGGNRHRQHEQLFLGGHNVVARDHCQRHAAMRAGSRFRLQHLWMHRAAELTADTGGRGFAVSEHWHSNLGTDKHARLQLLIGVGDIHQHFHRATLLG